MANDTQDASTLEAARALGSVRMVLLNTTHPGNIGATARAMKNMGLSDLRLVAPVHFPHADATARASGADDLLAQAVVSDTLDAAVAECHRVFGCSARQRSLRWPQLTPREAAEQLIAATAEGPVALLFGQERIGLTNEEMDACQALVTIPTDPAYSSLNIAAALQVMAYELRLAALANSPLPPLELDLPLGEAWARQEDVERFYEHLQRVLIDLDFLDTENPRHLMRRLRRLFSRTRLSANEVAILRGMLTAIQQSR
ncbi:tRNA/rRNA methyltransferase/tRNA (cytidine32/uridine32-2'-O)-methyltransferase [Ectothiorhodosinus mongolicus]|uniref:tRNA (cytidine/uridine-2'-O-)-methyltransferase TrmJ n=1 Tax=Ectothiorhodosinus mongolicus TaxID=233100 RepID=A0A1R3W653_9GAMM|nr:RNA methyltransferase [Ectothiorhodosinus mongolicus]ULX57652.1 tRNA (cytosine(32)/uridine(32)-2'-O)-methyltransferase TrmJ [Ectothiorhodosinus mongolicus]SIT73302.1 tRNA/rRNA methyltransferase/tRNA (cytidine32/uridine32-2'-O)-methyltransferase [Ectothiorhodosinus mongolicus]